MTSKISNRNDAAIADVLDKYKFGHKDMELEIRFGSISKETFLKFIEVADANYTFDTIEHSLNSISRTEVTPRDAIRSSKIRQVMFVDGKKSSDRFLTKNSLVRPIRVSDYINYTINLNSELYIDGKFNSRNDAEVRLKTRISYITPDGQWRLDITAVRSGKLDNIGPALPTIVKELFVPKTKDNFVELIDYAQITAFEAELEHIGESREKIDIGALDIVGSLFDLISPDYRQQHQIADEIGKVASEILVSKDTLGLYSRRKFGMKQLLTQAGALTNRTYPEFRNDIEHKVVTEKADGIRCLVTIRDGVLRLVTDEIIIIDPAERFDKVNKPTVPIDTECGTTILDGELIRKTKTLLLFDVMMIRGEKVSHLNIMQRHEHLNDATDLTNNYMYGIEYHAIAKRFVKLSADNLEEQLKSVYDPSKYTYNIDGMMFADTRFNYFETPWMKWKPIHENTNDFLTVLADEHLLGIHPFVKKPGYDLYILFVGISFEMFKKLGLKFIPRYDHIFPNKRQSAIKSQRAEHSYLPVQFSPSANPLDYLFYYPSGRQSINMEIVEMRKTNGKISDDWEIVRIRHDRSVNDNYFGNDYRIAELNYQNYIDPFPFEALFAPVTQYFKKESTVATKYRAKNGFHRFVISTLIKRYTEDIGGVKLAADLASGRGADIHRFRECGVDQTIFIDIDKAALTELIQRKFTMMHDNKRRFMMKKTMEKFKKSSGMNALVMSADLKTNYTDILKRLETQFNVYPDTVEYINCSFAIHYFCDNLINLSNFLKLVNTMLKIDGYFTAVVMNGQRVFDALSTLASSESFVLSDDSDENPKYKITKLYTSKKIADVGQNISVLLPFSDEMYVEPLCNIKHLVVQCKLHGLEVHMNSSFETYFSEFEKANRVMYNALTPADREYASMHQYLSFKKVKQLKK